MNVADFQALFLKAIDNLTDEERRLLAIESLERMVAVGEHRANLLEVDLGQQRSMLRFQRAEIDRLQAPP